MTTVRLHAQQARHTIGARRAINRSQAVHSRHMLPHGPQGWHAAGTRSGRRVCNGPF